MTTKTVLVIGSLNMDLVVSVEKLPHQGETVFGSSFATFPGGKGANQAVAAGKLGAAVKMAGCVGRDGFGADLLNGLQASHVDRTCVEQVDQSTGTALITVDAAGANTIVVVGGANWACGAAAVDKALAAAGGPGILVLQNEIPQETVEYAIKAAKAQGWTVIFNPAPARTLSRDIMPLVDIIIPNETETAVLTGLPADSDEAVIKAARKLLDQGIGTVVITLGARGSLCCNGSEQYRIQPYPVKAVDTTAAGDAYVGALATGLAEGRSLRDSLEFASAAASVAVTRAGAQPSLPWRREVDEFIRKAGSQE